MICRLICAKVKFTWALSIIFRCIILKNNYPSFIKKKRVCKEAIASGYICHTAPMKPFNLYKKLRNVFPVLFLWPALLFSQDSTVLQKSDSLQGKVEMQSEIPKLAADSGLNPKLQISIDQGHSLSPQIANPYVQAQGPIEYRVLQAFFPVVKDGLFYLLLGVLLFLGLIRYIFSKYFSDLFRIFFQTTFRQKSIREQLLQNRAASLALNLFFCISGGLFLYQLASYKHWISPENPWQTSLWCILLVVVVYTIKYVGLQISGWLFGIKELADTYAFIVFLINKVMGVMLLPATIMLALGTQTGVSVVLTLSLLVLGLLYFYRYIIAMPMVRAYSRVSSFHFFIYLCAFEIVPLLLVYKFVLQFIS